MVLQCHLQYAKSTKLQSLQNKTESIVLTNGNNVLAA